MECNKLQDGKCKDELECNGNCCLDCPDDETCSSICTKASLNE